MSVQPGDTLGHYRIGQALGSGGIGQVFRAVDLRTGLAVAVKVLRPEAAGDPGIQARFEREAFLATRMRSPFSVEIYDAGVDSGHFFLVMELVEGESLASLLQRLGPLPLRRALHIIQRVAWALELAEERGIVHRDIKPGNILIGELDTVKVADFGLARPALPLAADRLSVGYTPGYAPPEQLIGISDHRSDIFSVGVTLHEMLTGRLPYRTVEAPEPGLEQAPEPARSIIARCIAHDSGERHQHARELSAAIATALHALEPPGIPGAPTLDVRLEHRTTRRGGATFALHLTNPSRLPVTAVLQASDAASSYAFELPPAAAVPARDTVTLTVRAVRRAGRRTWRTREVPVSVRAWTQDGAVRAASASFREPPRLPAATLGAASFGVVAMLGVILAAMTLGGGGGLAPGLDRGANGPAKRIMTPEAATSDAPAPAPSPEAAGERPGGSREARAEIVAWRVYSEDETCREGEAIPPAYPEPGTPSCVEFDLFNFENGVDIRFVVLRDGDVISDHTLTTDQDEARATYPLPNVLGERAATFRLDIYYDGDFAGSGELVLPERPTVELTWHLDDDPSDDHAGCDTSTAVPPEIPTAARPLCINYTVNVAYDELRFVFSRNNEEIDTGTSRDGEAGNFLLDIEGATIPGLYIVSIYVDGFRAGRAEVDAT